MEESGPIDVDSSSSDESDDYSRPKREDAKFDNISSMNSVERSPYENYESAEVGEGMFDTVKGLLLRDTKTGNVFPEASRLFGIRLAESLVAAYDEIGKSGMLYSSQWQDGRIRGVQCGWIPKALL